MCDNDAFDDMVEFTRRKTTMSRRQFGSLTMGAGVTALAAQVAGAVATKESEAAPPPTPEAFAAMQKYNEKAVKAGILLAAEGLTPTSKGARVKFRGDERTVTHESKTKVEGGGHSVGTSGTTYPLTAREGVDLAIHVGEQVQISAVMIDAGSGQAKVKIEDQSRVESGHAPDQKSKAETKVEVPRGSTSKLMAMSVTTLNATCNAQ